VGITATLRPRDPLTTTPPTAPKKRGNDDAVSVSPIPENFFDDACWEDVTPAPAVRLATQPLSPLPQAAVGKLQFPLLLPRPAEAPALLEPEVVTDFKFQGRVLSRLTELLHSGSPTSLLCVQPTSSGKGLYASTIAKNPNTLVVLIVPYTKLAQEARAHPDSVDLTTVDPRSIRSELTACGRLAVTSFDSVAQHRPMLQSIQDKGVRVVLVFDEVHAALDCNENGGYR
jgi:hypothetical protein